MTGETENPVGTLGNQGSQDFEAMTSGNNQSQQQSSQNSGVPAGEQLSAQNDASGAKPTKALPQETSAGQTPSPSGNQQPTVQQSQADIIRATADAVAQAHIRAQQELTAQQRAAAPAPELSPEEFNKKFSVTRANEELVTTILGQDPKKAALALDQYGQNLVKQAILMTLELSEAKLGKFREEVTPHVTAWQKHLQEQQTIAAEQRFFQSAPDLQAEKDLVMELKDAFIAKVQAGQVSFKNEQEAFAAVANAARTILKRVNPQWGANGAANNSAPAAGQSQGRRMSAASSAGRSGTSQAAAKSDVDLVFGSDAH